MICFLQLYWMRVFFSGIASHICISRNYRDCRISGCVQGFFSSATLTQHCETEMKSPMLMGSAVFSLQRVNSTLVSFSWIVSLRHLHCFDGLILFQSTHECCSMNNQTTTKMQNQNWHFFAHLSLSIFLW